VRPCKPRVSNKAKQNVSQLEKKTKLLHVKSMQVVVVWYGGAAADSTDWLLIGRRALDSSWF
jgi:hypothetical protein